MYRTPVLLVIAVPLLVLGPSVPTPAAPVPKHLMKPVTYYYPTNVGAQWVYQTTWGPDQKFDVTAVEVEGEARIVTAAVVLGARRQADLVVRVSPAGLFRLTFGENKREEPRTLLQTPVQVGDAWTYRRNRERSEEKVVCLEVVRVPAGAFEAVRVEEERFDGCCFHHSTTWYAPGVGEVKWECTDGSSRVLKSFTPGRD